jgi:3-isopropylmalate dehydrogenase
MMLRYSLGEDAAAVRVERAVAKVLAQGLRTADLHEPGTTRLGTREMGEAVVAALE